MTTDFKAMSGKHCIKCDNELIKDYFYNGANNGFWCINESCDRLGIPVKISKEGSLPS